MNETNTWRTTRARTTAQLRLFVARFCYADSWVRYGFQFLRHDSGKTSRHERFYRTTLAHGYHDCGGSRDGPGAAQVAPGAD